MLNRSEVVMTGKKDSSLNPVRGKDKQIKEQDKDYEN